MSAFTRSFQIGAHVRAAVPHRPIAARAVAAPAKPATAPFKGEQPTTARVQYVVRPPNNEELFTYLYEKPEGEDRWTNLEQTESEVPVTDLRTVQEPFTLQRNGFQLEELHVPDDINWDDDNDVKARYWPKAEELLKRAAGASRVHVFDHTIRRGTIIADPTQNVKEGQPVARVHVDYTVKSGPERMQALLPAEEVAMLQKTPFAIIQLWRPLRGPLDNSPLGMIDAATVEKEDLLSYALHFPERTGYNYAVAENPNHRWYYAKGMTTEEAYVFMCYDSRDGRARFTPHTGFRDAETSPDALPRQSIEIRAYLFWEDLPEQQIARQL